MKVASDHFTTIATSSFRAPNVTKGCDVELRRQPRILPQPDRRAVDVNIENALRPAEMQHHAPSLPVGRHLERRRVNPGRVRLRHHAAARRKGHLDVRVMGRAVTLQRPISRHLDLAQPERSVSAATSAGVTSAGFAAIRKCHEPFRSRNHSDFSARRAGLPPHRERDKASPASAGD